ncbi:TonB-dependent receptor [Sphingosinithalassobacter sp. CS137]|uniref:TonB-dependent receptor n=1 Tax=Sphingosinithalassobacter sp. CS137 TaxID=2762748 RepID=UPI00165DDDE0|nr:TonB-dependent receptor [Sphingosinithalassobacter sp. CS137]
MASKLTILCSASLFALATVAAPAAAQTMAQDAPQEQDALGAGDQAPPREQADEIVVTGVRAAIIGGLENKREATQIIESVVAEDIGKLPDNNVIEALQRVTGVQVTNRARGEASAILIRGLPDVVTTMNGRNIFTASGRSFALADIPANLVSRIDVYKTRAASQIETGIAGQIDVFTRRPLDFDGFVVSGAGRAIYNEQADSWNPNVSGLVSNRWDTGAGDIGVLVSGSYSKTDYREMSVIAGAMVPFVTENPPAGTGFTPLQRVFPETGAWEPGLDRGLPSEAGSTFTLNGVETPYYLGRDALFAPDVHGTRERAAVSAALQWAPNASSQYTFEFFWNRYDEELQNSLLFTFVDWWGSVGPNPQVELFEGTNIIKSRTVDDVFGFNSGDFTKSRTDSFVYALNGKWEVGDLGGITADLSYQTSEFNTSFIANRIERVWDSVTYDTNPGNGIPSFNFNDNSLLTDPSAWTLAQFYDNANRSEGEAFTLHVDGVREFENSVFRSVKVGIRYDDRKAADSVRTQDAGVLGQPFSTLGDEYIFQGTDFFDGRANVPSTWITPRGRTIYENADEFRQLYRAVQPNLLLSDQMSLTRVFDINEVSMAAYIQADTEFSVFGRPLYVQAGVRYVDVDTDLTFTDRVSGTVTSTSQVTSDFLPSATVRYDITDRLRLRFNYGETLRRPSFPDLNPYFQLTGDLTGIGRGSGTGGNADLQPTTSKNYDLALEWYFAPASVIYTTLFRREIEGLVVPITSVIEYATPPLNDTANTTRFAITRPANASNGTLEGIEVGFTYFPTYLPGILDGLGVQGSLTVLDSNQNIPQYDNAGNVIAQDESPFFGVSDFSYNVTLAYDNGGLGLRLSYVWRDEFLSSNENRLFANPIGFWRTPEESLDFQLTYAVTDSIGITFDAVNLTEDVQQQYYRFGDVGNPEMFNTGTTLLPRTFAIGARFTFD